MSASTKGTAKRAVAAAAAAAAIVSAAWPAAAAGKKASKAADAPSFQAQAPSLDGFDMDMGDFLGEYAPKTEKLEAPDLGSLLGDAKSSALANGGATLDALGSGKSFSVEAPTLESFDASSLKSAFADDGGAETFDSLLSKASSKTDAASSSLVGTTWADAAASLGGGETGDAGADAIAQAKAAVDAAAAAFGAGAMESPSFDADGLASARAKIEEGNAKAGAASSFAAGLATDGKAALGAAGSDEEIAAALAKGAEAAKAAGFGDGADLPEIDFDSFGAGFESTKAKFEASAAAPIDGLDTSAFDDLASGDALSRLDERAAGATAWDDDALTAAASEATSKLKAGGYGKDYAMESPEVEGKGFKVKSAGGLLKSAYPDLGNGPKKIESSAFDAAAEKLRLDAANRATAESNLLGSEEYANFKSKLALGGGGG